MVDPVSVLLDALGPGHCGHWSAIHVSLKAISASDRKPERQCGRTPRDLFIKLHTAFNFTVDACASAENALLPRYWTAEDDCRKQSWTGERVFCNPPFRDTKTIWPKATEAEVAVMLVLLSSVATVFGGLRPATVLGIPSRRIQFDPPPGIERGRPPLPSVLAVFGCVSELQEACLRALGCTLYYGPETRQP